MKKGKYDKGRLNKKRIIDVYLMLLKRGKVKHPVVIRSRLVANIERPTADFS
jgi:hypothetical protein